MIETTKQSEYQLQPEQILYPVILRHHSSDNKVYWQVFISGEYSCLDNMKGVQLIIDCGAYVGYSSAYFLSRFPECQVIAVEPDPYNFELLQRNLAAYRDRVELINAAVWSCDTSLKLSTSKYRDGYEWTRQVIPANSGEKAEIKGLGIESILNGSGFNRISLLKIDIEGSEAIVFSENTQSWLNKTDTIAIELHNDSKFGNASQTFFSAISGHGFIVSRFDELTICRKFY